MFVTLSFVRSICFFLSLYLCISFLFKFIYLLIFSCAASLLLHGLFSSCGQRGLLFSSGAQAAPCGGFSSCGARGLGAQILVVSAPGLWSTGSVVVVRGFAL